MAFSGNFMCTSFKVELLQGKHDFTNGQDTFKIALYTNSASFTAATTEYTTSNEITGTGYTAGGNTLTNVTPSSSGTKAFTSFSSPTTWSSSTITDARGALIYNTQTAGGSSTTDTAVVLDFLANKSSSSGDFQVVFPTADATSAIIRIE